jgi:dihydrofolate synthase/folylpolyglutamate synthase
MGREWQVTPTSAGFRYDSDLLGLDLPAPALVGAHQLDNAATAVACIERLRAAQFRIDDAAIRKGLATVDWPARLQKLSRGPLVDAMPPASEVWFDGGHNEDCGLVLARQAEVWAREPGALPLYLIFGMLTTKDASGFLRPLARHASSARAVPIEGHAAYTPQEACERAADVGLDCLPANDVGAALEDLLATQPAPMRILICGSLYLAGTVLARNG